MEILDQNDSPREWQPADAGSRIVARILDSLIMAPFAFIPCVGFIVILAYSLVMDALPFLDGQSIGKKIMKLRAVTEDGVPTTNNYGASVIRNIVLFIPLFSIVELIVMLTDKQQRRLGDQWGKTRVVKA